MLQVCIQYYKNLSSNNNQASLSAIFSYPSQVCSVGIELKKQYSRFNVKWAPCTAPVPYASLGGLPQILTIKEGVVNLGVA